MLIQLKFQGCGLRRFAGHWAAAVLCGAIVAGCSGKIETPTEEYPPRRGGNEDANDTPPANTPRPTPTPTGGGTTPTPAPSNPPARLPGDPGPVGAGGGNAAPPDPGPAVPPAGGGDLSFATDIWPIFNGQCGTCHVTDGVAGQNIGSADLDEALADSKSFEAAVLSEIETGGMPPFGCGAPPGAPGCVSEEDFEAIQAWYEAGAAP